MADSSPHPPPTLFTLVFNDGFGDVTMGRITITPSLDYTTFITNVSRLIGLVPQQFNISVISYRKNPLTGLIIPDQNPVTNPVTVNTDFKMFVVKTEYEHTVYAVVNVRERGMGRGSGSGRGKSGDQLLSPSSPLGNEMFGYDHGGMGVVPDRILLRRGESGGGGGGLVGGYADYNARLRNVEIERQKYDNFMNTGAPLASNIFQGRMRGVGGVNVNGGGGSGGGGVYCHMCASGIVSVGFHPCVNDQVIKRKFVSPFGPISRPPKRSD